MNRDSRPLRTLSWTLFTVVLLGLVSCDIPSSPSASLKSSLQSRKYLELDDLNGYESPSSSDVENVGEKLSEDRRVELTKYARPKKLVKRSARIDDGSSKVQQQQRVVRQNTKKQRPGFFWTLARVTFETFNDTRSAIQQIGQILNDSIPPDPKKPKNSANLKNKPVAPKINQIAGANGTVTTTLEPTTTKEPEFMLTRPLLMSLIRRNVKGLVRLFNIEWRDALNQSEKNVQEFQRDLSKQLGIYLADNPNAY